MLFDYVAAVIFVREIERSREFYQDVLGLNVAADHGESVVFVGGLSIWEACHARRIIFCAGDAGEEPLGRDNLELYFESDDIDAAYAGVTGAGVEVVQPVHEEPWGQRTFRCHDPDGHIVEVGEPMPAAIKRLFGEGWSPERIVEKTSMPMETVLQAIGHPRFC